jgi:hypothetical protein
MAGSVQVNPVALAAIGQALLELAELVVSDGHELTGAGAPVLGGTAPSYELVDQVTTNVSSAATWVMTAGSALRALAQATCEAAEAYRLTDQQSAERFTAMAAAFDEFDDLYGLMTDKT